jgi:NTP pyrophosphatase (non-canonical NTP hydrolase)
MDEIKQLTDLVIDFRNARDWEQFHNSKDLALAISIEAAELLELFLWKDNEGADSDKIKEELADIFTFSLMMAHKHGLDVSEIIKEKIKLNGLKYPVDKSKGSSKKYTEL